MYISDYDHGGILYLHLSQPRMKRLGRKDRRGIIPNRVSIYERPASVDSNHCYGERKEI
jgi:hypothetical protein